MTQRTTAQHLADLLLGQPVEDFITEGLADERSWAYLARELNRRTDGRVAVTSRALQKWHVKAKQLAA